MMSASAIARWASAGLVVVVAAGVDGGPALWAELLALPAQPANDAASATDPMNKVRRMPSMNCSARAKCASQKRGFRARAQPLAAPDHDAAVRGARLSHHLIRPVPFHFAQG